MKLKLQKCWRAETLWKLQKRVTHSVETLWSSSVSVSLEAILNSAPFFLCHRPMLFFLSETDVLFSPIYIRSSGVHATHYTLEYILHTFVNISTAKVWGPGAAWRFCNARGEKWKRGDNAFCRLPLQLSLSF